MVKNGILYAFVPSRLAVPGWTELNHFPLNVMFARYKTENGITVMGTTLYEPDFISDHRQGSLSLMKYFNKYDPASWLVIRYDNPGKKYHGEKFVRGKSAGQAFGSQWNMFFVHFTSLGLSDGEACEFKEIKNEVGR